MTTSTIPRFESEAVVFNGITFRRYPNSSSLFDRNYYRASSNYFKRGIRYLHRYVWELAHGPIPAGHDIHHIDGNPQNNSLDNLACLSKSEHAELHAREMPDWKREWLAEQIVTEVQPKAVKWHQSEEGRQFHSELGKWSWQFRTLTEKTCEYCGNAFETRDRRAATRFCSSKCRAYARAASGVDNEMRTCLTCDTVFEVNRYSTVKHCSNSCAAKHREKNKRCKS